MPVTAPKPANVNSGNIIHIMGARLRIVGHGNVIFSVHSLQDVKSRINPNALALQETTPYDPLKKFNFMSQYIKLKMETTEMNEWFRVNRIIIFAREVFTQTPQ